MASVEIDDVVGLIHTWLKENHLLKTVRALESEYGKVIQNKENEAGLQSIITCFRALTGALLSTINHSGLPKGKPKPTPKGDTQQRENSVKKRTQKRNYSPLVPPGEWVCPEMKIALENLYNKMNLSIIKEENLSNNGQHPCSIEKAEAVRNETVDDPTEDTAEDSQHKKKKKKKKRKHENNEENIENGSIVIEDDATLIKDCGDLHMEDQASFSQKKEKKKKKKKENYEENIENGSIVNEDDATLVKDSHLHMGDEASFSQKKEKKKKKKKEKDSYSIQNNSVTELGDESLLHSLGGISEDEFIAFKKKKKKKKNKELVEEEEPTIKKRGSEKLKHSRKFFMIMSDKIPVNDVKEDVLELYGPLLQQEESNVNEKAEGETNASNVEDESKCKNCIHKTRSHRFWGPFVKFVKFTVHFLTVMLFLCAGAMAFSHLEDPYEANVSNNLDFSRVKKTAKDFTQNDTKITKSNETLELEKLWKSIIANYNFNISHDMQEKFVEEVAEYYKKKKKLKEKIKSERKRVDRMYVFKKWFYFVTIATTTIGYGDVYPVTKNGRFFYIVYSIIAIPLMIGLLASCGDIITGVNKKLFGVINNWVCRKKKWVSEELLSTISVLLLFLGYVAFGCIYLYIHLKWMLIDSIYFWIVTFTTVGFGDIVISVDDQENFLMACLVVYRTFGLALLAGLIDSLVAWVNVRKEELKKRASRLRDFRSTLLEKQYFISRHANENDEKGSASSKIRRKISFERRHNKQQLDQFERSTLC